MAGDPVREACEAYFEAHKNDGTGFARAVASNFDVQLPGVADQIVETLRTGPGWTPLPNGIAAAQCAKEGKLVIGGLKGAEKLHPDPHGHVVVVVAGPLGHDAYPSAYWGGHGGTGARNKTINWAWTTEDRDQVSYVAYQSDPCGIQSDPCGVQSDRRS
jgi:hypothetical protein